MPQKCLAFCLISTVDLAGLGARAGQPERGSPGRDDNALWMRRHWLHEAPAGEEIAALVGGLARVRHQAHLSIYRADGCGRLAGLEVEGRACPLRAGTRWRLRF
jgi:hypothetical protein